MLKKSLFVLITLGMILMMGCGKQNNEMLKDSENLVSENQVESGVTEENDSTTIETDDSIPNEQDTFIAPADYVSILEISINPKLNLYLDSDNVVLAIEYLNEDAKAAYANRENDLIGSTLEDATAVVIEEAIEQGYLTENKEVSFDVITCENEDSAFTHNLLLNAYETAESSIAERGMEVTINTKIADESISYEEIIATQPIEGQSGNTSDQGNGTSSQSSSSSSTEQTNTPAPTATPASNQTSTSESTAAPTTEQPSTPAPTTEQPSTPAPTATPTPQPSTAPSQTGTTQPTPRPAGTSGCPTCQGHQVCPNCHGAKSFTCNMCGGSGQHACPACGGSGLQPDGVSTCPECNGNGMSCFICHGTGNETCNYCNGSGLCWTCGGAGHL